MNNLIELEQLFKQQYCLEKQIAKSIVNIKNLLKDYKNNFLLESIDQLPEGIFFNDLNVEYRNTYIILDKANEGKPSFRLVFDLIEPVNNSELFTYELGFNNEGNFSDDFFMDY